MKRLCNVFFYKLLLLATFFSLPNLLFGQVSSASLTGLVTDPSSAIVAHARVTAVNGANGYTRSVETDSAGYYFFQELPIGAYTITVAQQGFAALQTKLILGTAEKVRRDFALSVGTAEQVVDVSSTASSLSPGDASISTVISGETIDRTPLYLRNWDDLLRVVPGVQISRYTQQSGATSAGRVGDFNVHGVHSLQNNFILDGIDNNTFSENVQELSTEAAHPSVETIQEFNVITNPYSAEYGRSPGAAVSVSTKTGSNQLHLLAYEYLRNQFFDANDFYSDRNHLKKPENNQHQFGGSIGGPFIQDKLFGFFNYEGTRIKQGVSRISTVPLPNERIGDFSPATAAALGIKYPTIFDPATGQPFANNQIPNSRIDPVVAKLMALFPKPNLSGQLNNYARNALATDSDDSYNGRIDWTASPKDTIFGRFSYSNRSRFIPGNYGGIADGTSTSAFGRQTLKADNFVLGWSHVFSPTLLNDFHFGFVRNYSYAQQDPFGKNAVNEFVPGVPDNRAVAGGVPLTTFSNFTFLGSPDFLPKRQIPQQFQWVDTLSRTVGAHSLKLGVDLWAPMRNIFQDEPGTRGDLTFNGNFTCQRDSNSKCIGNTGLPYADGLLGLVQSTQLTNVFFVDQRLWMISGFAQDDWKLTPRLSLNLGLRYDFASPVMEGKNQMANFNPAGSGSITTAASGSFLKRGLVQPNKTNFSPRFGFAYAVDSKTVVRGGYGIYYTMFERFGSENQLALNPPFLINKSLASSSTSTTPVLIARNGFPANFLDPGTVDLQHLQSFHIRAVNPDLPSPMVQQWSFGIQHQFSSTWSAELNYVGTKSTHLATLTDFNQPIITNGQSTGVVPYPNFGYIEYATANGYGNYHGLEASLQRHFQNGLSLRAAYTYSRSLDNSPQELESNSGGAPNGRNYAAWYGPSDFDIPHRFAVSYFYEFPFGPGKALLNHGLAAALFGGFRTSGVYTYYSGHPFTVNEGSTLGGGLDPFGQSVAVPNVIGAPHIIGDPNCWYYVAANKSCQALAPGLADTFQLLKPGVVGNSSRNSLRGPHITVFDAALMREFPMGERTNLEFRWEVFNASNTPEFGQPNNNFSSSAAGSITTLSGDPRVMQFALRFSF